MVKAKMTSDERLRAAIACEPVDYVPCAPWFSGGPRASRASLADNRQAFQTLLEKYQPDRHTRISIAPAMASTVTSKFSIDKAGEVLRKVFHTPDGDLSASLRTHETLNLRDDIRLVSDYNPPLFIKPWIETISDVEALKHIWQGPDDQCIADFKKDLKAKQSSSEKFGCPIIGQVGCGLSGLINMMGGEAAVLAGVDNPRLLERFMDIEHEMNLKQIEIMLDCGVDLILRNGFYETCDFWNPSQVKDLVLTRVNEEAKTVHSSGGRLLYTACTGIFPLLDLYLESDIDCFIKFETKLTGQFLGPIAEKLAGRKALWGGLSDCEDLGRATPERTRQAVREAFELVGKRGLILAASPSIKPERPVENVEAMFDEWTKLR